MRHSHKKTQKIGLRKLISVIFFCCSLLFLTGINFFLYPPEKHSNFFSFCDNDDSSQGPVEEKAPGNKGVSTIQEEYLHEHSSIELLCFNSLSLHKIHAAEMLQLGYDEILVPP